jgi:hypothetical protein
MCTFVLWLKTRQTREQMTLDLHRSVHHNTNLIEMTNNMQLCLDNLLFYCSLTAEHVSSYIIAHHNTNLIEMTNNMQLCLDNLLFYCSLTAEHVSSYIIAHYQELLNCNYRFWFYTCLSLPAAVMVEWELSHDSDR